MIFRYVTKDTTHNQKGRSEFFWSYPVNLIANTLSHQYNLNLLTFNRLIWNSAHFATSPTEIFKQIIIFINSCVDIFVDYLNPSWQHWHLCVFQVKGLVKQHIDSFNYFINVEVRHNNQHECVCYCWFSWVLNLNISFYR